MLKINLLPWREERRKQREQTFYMMIGGSVLAAVLASLLVWFWFNGQIAGQHDRNAFLEAEIKKVDEQIKDIEALKQKKEALLNRKQVIEELQGNRFQMVHLFDALMRTVPEGLMLTALKQEGEQMTLEGRAQSNARVATYMRNLEGAGWMKNPDVNVIEASQAKEGGAVSQLPYVFTMRVTLSNPSEPRDPNAPPTPDPVPVPAPADAPAGPPAAVAPITPAPAATDAAPAAAAPAESPKPERPASVETEAK
ncbi:fimbrial protein [Lysobacter pythonis]|uniref:Fimbrial protein n=1 Tax=Solilutibacter pythonis TaxID=2483112 RepID=A0A3M2I0W2_9GAMM|nr:PilN domain-containing protein [Lysobacter pythonis]RMH93289.1 fimbrial protein [Lysobacter pythonis]